MALCRIYSAFVHDFIQERVDVKGVIFSALVSADNQRVSTIKLNKKWRREMKYELY
jgi:hypothetical protein